MFNPFSLEGKNILVTGASSGIGKATAIVSAKMGAKITAVGRNVYALENLVSELEGEGHSFFELDLSDESSWQSMIEKIPALDGIACCAGIAGMNPFQFISKEEVERMFCVNYYAPVMMVKRLLDAKKIKKCSSVVFVSSVDGPKIVHAGNSVYSASKNALVGMARNMAIDLIGKKIRVNCVLPGTTDTPLIRTANVDEVMLSEKAKSLPMKRFAQPDEIANAMVFLLSDASSYMTGTELVVDGGCSVI